MRDQSVVLGAPPFIQSGEQHSVMTGVPPVLRMRAIRLSRLVKS